MKSRNYLKNGHYGQYVDTVFVSNENFTHTQTRTKKKQKTINAIFDQSLTHKDTCVCVCVRVRVILRRYHKRAEQTSVNAAMADSSALICQRDNGNTALNRESLSINREVVHEATNSC